MRKHILTISIIIFVQLTTLIINNGVYTNYNQQGTYVDQLSDNQIINDEIIVNNINKDNEIDNSSENKSLVSNNHVTITDNYYKIGETTITASSDAFISRWDTYLVSTGSSNASQIKLPLEESGNYNFIVDWGDNTNNDIITIYNQSEVIHTYATVGEYNIIINGTLKGWRFNNQGDRLKLLEISQWGSLNLGNSNNYFSGSENLVLTATDAPDLNGTTFLNGAFSHCHNLGRNGNMNLWDVSSVTDMRYMFNFASDFSQPIGTWNVSSVTDMRNMFNYAARFNQPIGDWNVSSVTNMSCIFYNAGSFNQPIGTWNVSSVTDMSYMFFSAGSFNQPIGTWDVSSVTDMSNMFLFARFNQLIGTWDVSSVTDMSNMFYNAGSFNQSIGTWDVSSVTDMSYMFFQSPIFNQPIGEWDVSNVIDMNHMFCGANSFNQSIGTWDVSSVTDMSYMFFQSFVFNQPIGDWDISSVTNMCNMFYRARAFNQPIGTWNVSSVTDMSWMFNEALKFNQPIGNWDVSNVKNMNGMFKSTIKFNQSICDWDVSSVTNMNGMFTNTIAFNQPIGDWDVSNVTDMENMFLYTTLSISNYNNLLLGWSLLSLQSGVIFNAGFSRYSIIADDAKNHIISTYDWTITDGGILLTVSSSPQFLQAIVSDNQVNLTWSVPASDGGSPITDYNIYRSTTSGSHYALLAITNETTYAYTDSLVTLGEIFYYVITAVNNIGESEASNELVVLIGSIPSVPQSLQVTSIENQVVLSWSAPLSTGGFPIISYMIYCSTSSGSEYNLLNIVYGNTFTYNDSSVTLGQTHYYIITAVNSIGESEASNEVFITPIFVPSAPQTLQANKVDNKVILSWDTPTTNGGDIIAGYNIYRSTISGSDYVLLTIVNDLTYNDSSVTLGQNYFYIVTAINIIGESEASNEVYIKLVSIPSAPQSLLAIPGDNQISLSWSISESDGGVTIIGYMIYRSLTSGTEYDLLTMVNGSTSTYSDTMVINDQTYFYIVTAVNNIGESDVSNEVNATLHLKSKITYGFEVYYIVVVFLLVLAKIFIKNRHSRKY